MTFNNEFTLTDPSGHLLVFSVQCSTNLACGETTADAVTNNNNNNNNNQSTEYKKINWF
jgi:hypothetical protein